MKAVSMTFSVPEEINRSLHALIERRGLSRFVSEAIAKALESKKSDLKAAYLAANEDADLKQSNADWEGLDIEGFDETIS
jgi:hypothetical protein